MISKLTQSCETIESLKLKEFSLNEEIKDETFNFPRLKTLKLVCLKTENVFQYVKHLKEIEKLVLWQIKKLKDEQFVEIANFLMETKIKNLVLSEIPDITSVNNF